MSKKTKKSNAAAPRRTRETQPPAEAGEPEIIDVPEEPHNSFNPERPIERNSLLQAQLDHFHELNRQLPGEHKMPIAAHEIHTEGEASEFIRQVTARLHGHHRLATKKPEKARKAT